MSSRDDPGLVKTLTGDHGSDPRSGRRRTLPQVLFEQAAARPDATYMRVKRQGVWAPVTWSEFARQVRTVAHALARTGVGSGDVVAAISENLPELYLIEYGAQCLGAAATCLYPDASAEELDYILEHSGARVLFAQDQEQVDKALGLPTAGASLSRIVYLESLGLWNYEDARLQGFDAFRDEGANPSEDERRALDDAIAGGRDDAIASLCYTSGTTGRPKGVVQTHRYLLDNAYRLIASFDIPADLGYLSYISPAWAAEQITGIALGLLAPSVVHFGEKPETVQADLREIGPQFLLFTPRQWEMMASGVAAAMLDAGQMRRRLVDWAFDAGARASDSGRSSLRHWLAERLVLRAIRDNLGLKHVIVALSAGSGMSAEVFRRFHAMGVPLRNLYGSTEYGLISAHWGGSFDPATMGRLLRVDADAGEPLQVHVDAGGELKVRGASGFAGYYRDSASTEAVIEEGLFRTGDAVRLGERDELVFLDRVKDLRHLSGDRWFPPQFIENRLRASPYIRDAIAIGNASRPFVTVLVNIDQQIVGRYAETRGIAWSTFADLSQHPEVHGLLRETLREINAQLDEHARAVCFASFPKELDADDEELTRSRKLRRDVIEQRYCALIEAMYAGHDDCPIEVLVRYRDGTTTRVQQRVRVTRVEG
ncbi:MAG: acyl-CoA synthetase [Burkholderiales bacterium]|nr:MAG: acyl-CoA synthetase [Burkholderiales bacterium]